MTTLCLKAPQLKIVEEKDLGHGLLDNFVELLLVEPHGDMDCLPHFPLLEETYSALFMFLLFQVSVTHFLMKTEAFPSAFHTGD